MADVVFRRVAKSYSNGRDQALVGLDLIVGDGESLVLLGRPGSGKSTALRLLAGREKVTSGTISIGDRDVTNLSETERNVAFIVEHEFPEKRQSAGDNIKSVLYKLGIPKGEVLQRIQDVAQLMGLHEFLNRKAGQLSAGQQQRVVMACAIVSAPDVLLLDEPLRGLDDRLVASTRSQIRALQGRLGLTAICATQNEADAMILGDRIAVLKDGALEQCDAPRRLYEQPSNLFVAGMIGSPPMNLFEGQIVECGVKVGDYIVPLARESLGELAEDTLVVGIRPEHCRISIYEHGILLNIVQVDDLVSEALVYGEIVGLGVDALSAPWMVAKVSATSRPARGDSVRLLFDLEQVCFFSKNTGRRLDTVLSRIVEIGDSEIGIAEFEWNDSENWPVPSNRTAKLPPPELPAGRRSALVVATTSYGDPSLRAMRAPATDAIDFASTMADQAIGAFSVTTVIDRSVQEWRLSIVDFLSDRSPDELIVVYISCHGVTDQRRRLYFTATDTVKNRLAATGLSAHWLAEQLDECRARSQIVILDCCFSGAFTIGAKSGEDVVDLHDLTEPARGRVVLTASNAREYSFEASAAGPLTSNKPAPGSVFTSALLAGLKNGSADKDGDGFISVDEAYDYAYRAVRAQNVAQTPQRAVSGGEGQLILARNPVGREVLLPVIPVTIRDALASPEPSVRIRAVKALGKWIGSRQLGQAIAAEHELRYVVDKDIPSVASEAHSQLTRPRQDK